MNHKLTLIAGTLLAGFTPHALAQYPGWQHQGACFILTTPEGADLPATAAVENFPLLLRLNKGTFDFSQAKPDGADLRVSAGDRPLAYQIGIYLDGVIAPINTGKAEGNLITLQLSKPANAKSITYLSGKDWDGKLEKLLIGANGIGALTFADVAIGEPGK